ncbi:MAG TPA: methylated-DNA--[protein]-cysteine S-methyltransferase [Gaiellaceae bacterium]|jgi:methylated-DNA-[protein]-cysteine S-methyltransferase|nr:methylated-DNA--[protein]-cysteine S-methyltransferase [Gaiellaceae bacterium]
MARHSKEVQVLSYEVPGWGVGELYLDGERLLYHELPSARKSRAEPRQHPLAERMRRYFAGERVEFTDVQVDPTWSSDFQASLADALRAVPYGETVTYGELAALAGRPNAHRAAGTFCAGNRFPLVVPCHRVVAAGGLGGYGSLGGEYKRRLLELEHAL